MFNALSSRAISIPLMHQKGQTVRGRMKVKEMAGNAADDLEEVTQFKANTTSSLTTPPIEGGW